MIDDRGVEILHIIIENFFLKKTEIKMALNESNIFMTSNIVANNVEQNEEKYLLREYVGAG
jgi:hypothetical protein